MASRLLTLFLGTALLTSAQAGNEPTNIGSRLELLVDGHLVDRMSGHAELRLHPPTPREVALVGDNPWEGTLCAHYTVFRDGSRCRMYYRGANEPSPNAASSGTSPAFICYAESQ